MQPSSCEDVVFLADETVFYLLPLSAVQKQLKKKKTS